MEDLHRICYPGLSVNILRCDPVPVLSVFGDLQELMLRLKIFCAAVGDGTAVLNVNFACRQCMHVEVILCRTLWK